MADWRKILASASKTGLAASAYVRSSTWSDTCPISSLDLAALETGRPFLVATLPVARRSTSARRIVGRYAYQRLAQPAPSAVQA